MTRSCHTAEEDAELEDVSEDEDVIAHLSYDRCHN